MQPERLDTACKYRVRLDSVKDIEATVEVLVLAEVQVDRVEDEPDGDVPVER